MPRPLLSVPPRSLLCQLVPKDKRKIPPRKTAPRMPGQTEGKDPKKLSESKKDPANPGEVKKGSRKPGEGRAAPSKPGAAKKAPKKGTQTKDPEARLGEAKKSSQRPDKAAQAPPSASGPGRKSKVKERGSRQGMGVNGVGLGWSFWQPLAMSWDGRVGSGEEGVSTQCALSTWLDPERQRTQVAGGGGKRGQL